MRILEVTNYTKGGCGVGMRVLKESRLLAERGHKVAIFSTNYVKGSLQTCPLEEQVGKVRIRRFPAKKLAFAGDSYNVWDFTQEALSFRPDVIIAHSYRHQHTTQALRVAKKLGCRVFLVTHAPFGREETRSRIQNIGVRLYDNILGKKALKSFDKVIAITKWELPYLEKLGVPKEKLVYLPNGIDKEFFAPIRLLSKAPRKMGYWGRISRIKQIETISEALLFLKDTDYILKIRGPAEEDYLAELKEEIEENGLADREEVVNKEYSPKEQIKGLDEIDIFILPSKTEGMPQTLIEAMSRGKIVVASDNQASRDLIDDEKNGFIFKNSDAASLADVLRKIKHSKVSALNNVQKQARLAAEKFKWDKLIDNMEMLIKNG